MKLLRDVYIPGATIDQPSTAQIDTDDERMIFYNGERVTDLSGIPHDLGNELDGVIDTFEDGGEQVRRRIRDISVRGLDDQASRRSG